MNNSRAEDFLEQSLKDGSPDKAPDQALIDDLAFIVVDYFKIKTGNAKTIIGSRLPLLAMVDQASLIDNSFEFYEKYKYVKDPQVRDQLVKKLTLSQLLAAAHVAGVKHSDVELSLWKKLLTYIIDTPLLHLPTIVSKKITTYIIKGRCNSEADFLERHPTILNSFNTDHFNHQGLNLKSDLCSVVADLNILTKKETQKKITSCTKELENRHINEFSSKEDVDQILKDGTRFMLAVDEWDKLDNYSISKGPKEYVSRVNKLHEIATNVNAYANTCMAKIKKSRKTVLVSKRKSGNNLSIMDYLKSYVLL